MLYRHPNFQYIYKRPWALRKIYLGQKGFFRRLVYASGGAVFIVSLAAINILLLPKASAFTQLAASDEIGQVNGSDQPIWTQNAPDNNSGSVNAQGLDSPVSDAVDNVHHRLFVADRPNERVLVFNLDSSNHLIDHTADNVLGEPNFTSVDATCNSELTTTQSQICDPTGLAYDPVNNRLFVGDDVHSTRILVFDFSGGISDNMNASFVLGTSNFTAFGSGCTPNPQQNTLCSPDGLAYDSSHSRLFVTDYGLNRILIYDLSGGISDGMNASWVLGQANFTSDSCGAVSASEICSPQGDMAYDAADDYLFVSIFSENRVLVFNLSGGITNGMNAFHVIGQTNFTNSSSAHTQTGLQAPTGVVYDSTSKRLFVQDTWNNRVMEYSLYGGISDGMAAMDAIGQPDFTTNTNNTNQQGLWTRQSGWGMSYDSTTNKLYVDDGGNDRVMIYDIGPLITSTNLPDGTPSTAYSATVMTQDTVGTNTFTITSGGLPPGLNIGGSSGTISGTPTTQGVYNFTVQVTDQIGETASRNLTINIGAAYSASDLLGQVNGSDQPVWTHDIANNNLGSSSPNPQGMDGPEGIAMDTIHHRLFVADSINSRVLIYNLDSNNNLVDHTADNVLGQTDLSSGVSNANCGAGLQTASNFCQPNSVTYDSNHDRLFVADNYDFRILVFDFSGGITDNMNASWVLGQPNFTSQNCVTSQSGQCGAYGGSVYDTSTNYFYVGDSGASRVMVYDLSGGISNGMNASYELGQSDFTSTSASSPTQSSICGPGGMALDQTGHRLFVGDWCEPPSRIMVFDTSSLSNGMNASYELGETDFTSGDSAADTGGPADAVSFSPDGATYDSKDNLLFVEDYNTNRVMVFDASNQANGQAAIGVLGQTSLTAGTYSCDSTSQTSICEPNSLSGFYDEGNNRLYVSDYVNNRVMIYDFARLAAPAPDGTAGTSYSYGTNGHSQGTTAFSLTSGALPNGVNLDGSTGALSGTPTTPGLYNFGIHLADDNGPAGTFTDDHSYSLTINSAGPDNTPPSTPAGLTVTGTTSSSVSLAWSASTDNVGVTGYNVYRDGGGVPVGSTAATTFTDSGLASGTTYTYTVTAFDAAANESGHSNQASGKTGSSSGGGGGGGNSQGGSSGQSASSSPASPPAPINLDDQPGFSDGTGYSHTSGTGQEYTFTDTNGGNSITLDGVQPDSVTLNIDNSQSTVTTGQTITPDVTGDGRPDVSIKLNSTDNGQANLTFKKILTSAHPAQTGNTGSGGGTAGPGGSSFFKRLSLRIPRLVLLSFPWLLFILLGASFVRLAILSLQERRRAGELSAQLAREKALAEEKNNFASLSSHYLRTPVTAISGGIELIGSLSRDKAGLPQLQDLTRELNKAVNNLIATAEHRAPAEIELPAAGVIQPLSSGLQAAAGFIQLSSLPAIVLALAGSFLLVGVADYILKYVDLYDVSLVGALTQLAALGLLGILLFSSKRSFNKHHQLRAQAEALLAQQRELNASRDTLVKNSLDKLSPVLGSIKAKLKSSGQVDPRAMKPALDGIAQLEGLLGKFVILSSLEAGSMSRAARQIELSQLVSQSLGRYANAIAGKGLVIKNSVSAASIYQDPLLLSFVVDSLLNNAIKYSPQNGEIELSSRIRGKQVELYVKDSGPGIAQDKQAQLFEPFSRAENAATDFNVQGAGLSLYLDRLVMTSLGGSIGLDSQPGEGATALLVFSS